MQPVYLFGAGNCGENYLNVLEENEIPVEAFLDDHAQKQKNGFCGQYKPRIAFCIYYRKDGMFNIPLYLQRLNNGYKFYMRHYSEIPVESVVYAIDNSRV